MKRALIFATSALFLSSNDAAKAADNEELLREIKALRAENAILREMTQRTTKKVEKKHIEVTALSSQVRNSNESTDNTVPSWIGYYAGMNAGYGFGVANNAQNYGWANPNVYSSVETAAIAGSNSYMGRDIAQGGFIGGGQAGYNFQFGKNIVLGFEADIQGAGIGGQGSASGVAPTGSEGVVGSNAPIQAGVNWLGTARGRLGYLVAPSVLLYATGGLSYGGTYLKTFPTSYSALTDGSGFADALYISTQNAQQNFNVGWTAGGGAEWMVSQNWSVKGEALYYDLGNTSVTNIMYLPGGQQAALMNPVGGSTTRAYYQGVIARAGVNYHFNLSTTPVVAKF